MPNPAIINRANELVRSPAFQAQAPELQVEAFKSFLAREMPDVVNTMDPMGFERVASDAVRHFAPSGWGAVPVLGSVVRAAEARSSAPALVRAILPEEMESSTAARTVAAGLMETAFLVPALRVGRWAGQAVMRGAETVGARAVAGELVAQEAGRIMLRRQAASAIAEGAAAGLADSLTRRTFGGHPDYDPLSTAHLADDLIIAPIAGAVLGRTLLGVSRWLQRIGPESFAREASTLAQARGRPEHAARIEALSRGAERLRRAFTAGGGKVDTLFNVAMGGSEGVIAQPAERRAVMEFLQRHPEHLADDFGLHLLAQVRDVAKPSIAVASSNSVEVENVVTRSRRTVLPREAREVQELQRAVRAGQERVVAVRGSQAFIDEMAPVFSETMAQRVGVQQNVVGAYVVDMGRIPRPVPPPNAPAPAQGQLPPVPPGAFAERAAASSPMPPPGVPATQVAAPGAAPAQRGEQLQSVRGALDRDLRIIALDNTLGGERHAVTLERAIAQGKTPEPVPQVRAPAPSTSATGIYEGPGGVYYAQRVGSDVILSSADGANTMVAKPAAEWDDLVGRNRFRAWNAYERLPMAALAAQHKSVRAQVHNPRLRPETRATATKTLALTEAELHRRLGFPASASLPADIADALRRGDIPTPETLARAKLALASDEEITAARLLGYTVVRDTTRNILRVCTRL